MATNPTRDAFFAACPDGHEVWVGSIETLGELSPGDLVLRYRADNGHRGGLRIREAVIVARFVPVVESEVA